MTVATVNGHRSRINAAARDKASGFDPGRAREVVRFDSSTRARRYARSLGARVHNAEFTTQRMTDGSYTVTMNVKASGLSLGDLTALDQLGWPGAD